MKVKINHQWYDTDKDDNILIHFKESELKHIRTKMDETARRYSITTSMSQAEWFKWSEIPKGRLKLIKQSIFGEVGTYKFVKKMKKLLRKDENA